MQIIESKNILENNKAMAGLQKLEDFGATWYLGKSENEPLLTCINNAKSLKHKFIVAYDYFHEGMTRPTKVYGSYKNSRKFYKQTKNIETDQRCFYVVVQENTGCCLFADLEWDLGWKSVDDIKQKFMTVVGNTLKSAGVELDTDEYLFANACDESTNKGSLHCHVPCIYFKDIKEQRRFFNAVHIELDKESNEWFFIEESDKSYILKTFIDFGVYNKNRQIRLPYSSKMKKDGIGVRPLIPEDQDNFDFQQWTITDLDECDDEPVDVSSYPAEITCCKRNVWSKELVQRIVDELGLDVTVDTFKGNNLISLRNKKSIRTCPINGEENKSDNAYLVIRDNKLHYYCHNEECKGCSKVIHEFEEDSRIIETKLVDCCLDGSHADCARLFQHRYGHNISVTDKKDGSFYHWNSTTLLWEYEPCITMIGLISNNLSEPFKRSLKFYLNKLNQASDKGDKAIINAKLKKINKCMTNINTSPYLNNIIKFYLSYSINKDFESKIVNKTTDELPIKNGKVINLRTLEIRNRTRKDYWSVECPVEYNPSLDLTDVHQFMDSITCNSTELKDYHRRLWGYMMTGEISDRSLHIFWGNGCNGKSSMVNIFKGIMGDVMATSLSEDVMVGKKSSRGASPEMMDLLYARCGIMPESEKKERINSKRVKTITGDDDIKARHLYGHLVQFRTQCKAIWPTNHKPVIDVEDQAILDRLKLIPFLGRFEKNETNTKYIKHLQDNCLDQFFTWFCTGVRDWYDGSSLKPTPEMMDEMNKYISECDAVAEFIEDTYDIVSDEEYENVPKMDKSKYRTERSMVYGMFMAWIGGNNKKDESMGKKEFYKALSNKYTHKNIKNKYFYLLREKGMDHDESDVDCGIRLL